MESDQQKKRASCVTVAYFPANVHNSIEKDIVCVDARHNNHVIMVQLSTFAES